MCERACVMSFSLENSIIITAHVVLKGPPRSGIPLHQDLYTAQ